MDVSRLSNLVAPGGWVVEDQEKKIYKIRTRYLQRLTKILHGSNVAHAREAGQGFT